MSKLYFWLRFFGSGAVIAAAIIGLIIYASDFFRGDLPSFVFLVFGIFGLYFVLRDIDKSIVEEEW